MFLVVPIGHQHSEARQWPLVTTLIIAACLVMLTLTELAEHDLQKHFGVAVGRAVQYAREHPYLKPPPPFEHMPEGAAPVEPPADDVMASEQRVLDNLAGDVRAVIAARPSARFGWVPARKNWLGLVTYQFLHGGWLHFGFNAWFLWLCGCNVEDRWGRAVYLPFYLCAGIVAALAHALFTSTPTAPLIGASGAVAGAMGAFLFTHGAARVRFGYATWFLRPIWGTFEARAFVVLPFWLVSELADGVMRPDDSAAHWAHVGGFLFGSAVALLLKATGVDARLEAKAERAITTTQDPRLRLAGQLIDQGHFEDAFSRLEHLERERPDDIDVLLETSRAALSAKDLPREARASLRLAEVTLAAGMREAALGHVAELEAKHLLERTSREERFRVAERFARQGLRDPAARLYRSIFPGGIDSEIGVRAAIACAMFDLREGRPREAEAELKAALESRFCTQELAEKIQAQRQFARTSAPPAAGPGR